MTALHERVRELILTAPAKPEWRIRVCARHSVLIGRVSAGQASTPEAAVEAWLAAHPGEAAQYGDQVIRAWPTDLPDPEARNE